MLPEETKKILSDWVDYSKQKHGPPAIDAIRRTGPARVIEIMLEDRYLGQTKGSEKLTAGYYYDLEQNRAEAEQYLAELIGGE